MPEQATQTAEALAQAGAELMPQTGRNGSMVVSDSSSFQNLLDTGKFEHMWRVSKVFASSGMVPKIYQGKPEACFVAIQMAIRLEIDPFMFLQKTYISPQGSPAMYGQLAIALVNAKGPFAGPIQYELSGEGEGRKCRAFAKHAKTGDICEITVSIEMAQAEGWYKNNPKWRNIPDLMLCYRAGAWLGRVYAPECLMGMQTTEELEDIRELVEDSDGTFREAPPRPKRSDFTETENVVRMQQTEEAATVDAETGEVVEEDQPEQQADAEPEQQAEEGEPDAWAFIDLDGEEQTFEDDEAARQAFEQMFGGLDKDQAVQFWTDNQAMRKRLYDLPNGQTIYGSMRLAFKEAHGSYPPKDNGS
jgi:hypothetical protein